MWNSFRIQARKQFSCQENFAIELQGFPKTEGKPLGQETNTRKGKKELKQKECTLKGKGENGKEWD